MSQAAWPVLLRPTVDPARGLRDRVQGVSLVQPTGVSGQQGHAAGPAAGGVTIATPRLGSMGSRGSPLVSSGRSATPQPSYVRVPSADDAVSFRRPGMGLVQVSQESFGRRPSLDVHQAQAAAAAAREEVREEQSRELRDLRERMDAQERRVDQQQQEQWEFQRQQLDANAELHRELQKLREECAAYKYDIDKIAELQADCDRRAEGLAAEGEARYEAERAHAAELAELRDAQALLRELIAAEAERSMAVTQQAVDDIAELQQLLLPQRTEQPAADGEGPAEGGDWDGCEPADKGLLAAPQSALEALLPGSEHADGTGGTENERDSADGEVSLEREPVLCAHDAEEIREALSSILEHRLQESRAENTQQVADLERRITEEWTGLRGWVDAAVVAVVNRISSLECSLQNEMVERSARTQEIADAVLDNTEQVKQLQGEIDKLVLESQLKAQVRSVHRSGSAANASLDSTCSLGGSDAGGGAARGDSAALSTEGGGASPVGDGGVGAAAAAGTGPAGGSTSGSGAYAISAGSVTLSVGSLQLPLTTPPAVVQRGQSVSPRSSMVFPRAQSFGGASAAHTAATVAGGSVQARTTSRPEPPAQCGVFQIVSSPVDPWSGDTPVSGWRTAPAQAQGALSAGVSASVPVVCGGSGSSRGAGPGGSGGGQQSISPLRARRVSNAYQDATASHAAVAPTAAARSHVQQPVVHIRRSP